MSERPEGGRGGPAPGDASPVGPDERQAVIDSLSEHFAADRLSLEELERRLDRANRAVERRELDALLDDLPGGARPPAREAHEGEAGAGAGGAAPPARWKPRVPAPPEWEVPGRSTDLSIWGGRSRSGSWTPPRRHTVLALQGGAELDYRDARLAPGVYELRAYAVMGAVEVVVPPDLRVEAGGTAILGSFELEGTEGAGPGSDAPVLRVGGFAVMGSVEVVVEEPGKPLEEGGSR